MSQSPFSAFGSTKAPKPVVYPWVKPLLKPAADLGRESIDALRTGGAESQRRFDLGTPRQEALQGEQEGVLRTLLARNLSADPTQLLRNVGNTAFSFIDPNVVNPLARFDVNSDRIDRMARGLNPAALDSTSARLRDARIASGRYYDVARNVFAQLPSLYNQVFNAGITNDQLSRGYIPEIMSGYRNIEMSPFIPAMARAEAANAGAGIVSNNSAAAKAATYGFKQPKNIWDKLGQMDSALWDRLGEAVNMASSVMGMVGGGGAGGMLGGMMGGGGGGGGGLPGGANSAVPQPNFIPSPPAAPAGGYYPGSVSPYGPPSYGPIRDDPFAPMRY